MNKNSFTHVVIMGNDVDRLGGIGRFMNQMAIEFHKNNFSVELLGVTPPPTSEHQVYSRPRDIQSRFLWTDVAPENWTLKTRMHQLNLARRARNRKRLAMRAEAIGRLSTLIHKWGPNTVIICTQVLGMEHLRDAGYNPANPNMPRVIGQYHGSFDMCKKTGDLRRIIRNYSEIEKFVCLSSRDAELFQKASLNNTSWIPNPVELPNLTPVSRENVFVAVARYDKQKSLEYFLRAWSMISASLPDWRVELYGEGVLRPKLEAIIAEESIPRATLMGMTADVGTVFSKSKVHVLSSQYEGLPIAIVEAGIAGVPTIAFDCAPGIHDLIIHEESGLIVNMNSIGQLSQAMQRLATQGSLLERMSESAIAHSRQYSPDRIISDWLDLFVDIRR